MIESAREADLTFRVPVTIEPGAAISDLTGATLAVFATDGYVRTDGTAVLSAGNINVSFAENSFPRGRHTGKVLATVGSITQCVATFDLLIF